ncbi:Uncharacterised protein [Pseudomonas fluorescens]|uniref:Uncharacterized protein n=1 Tax=Pseudomonas fluorescens TaxID=294 RepID=A0A379ILM7_PSEFL|nr:Uncharacterised protein [Pseudomonas fluorescens]
MNSLIGFSGFVGGTLLKQACFEDLAAAETECNT